MRDDYIDFIERVKNRTGIDLSLYKEKQMKRRLTTLRDKRGFKTFIDYFDAMIKEEQLYYEFLDRMTINVSEFYRNFNRWETLRNDILPSIKEGKGKLKVWSAACSTGEEPYTMAMILSDYFSLKDIAVHATDIDDQAINRAQEAIYPERSLKEVPRDKKAKFFTKRGDHYVLSDDVKRCVNFSKHNLLADSYQSNYDLIVCRNVLIYFTEEAKQQVYQLFSQSLVPGGVLFVGSTEQIFNPQQFNLNVAQTFFYEKQV